MVCPFVHPAIHYSLPSFVCMFSQSVVGVLLKWYLQPPVLLDCLLHCFNNVTKNKNGIFLLCFSQTNDQHFPCRLLSSEVQNLLGSQASYNNPAQQIQDEGLCAQKLIAVCDWVCQFLISSSVSQIIILLRHNVVCTGFCFREQNNGNNCGEYHKLIIIINYS